MTTKAQREKEAAAAELGAAKNELAADGSLASAAAPVGTTPPVAPDAVGGLTPAITREPGANPLDTTARRAARGQRVTTAAEEVADAATDDDAKAHAAHILRCHVEEVLVVEDSLVTTFDGQQYELTGDEPGDYVWHAKRPAVPQVLGR